MTLRRRKSEPEEEEKYGDKKASLPPLSLWQRIFKNKYLWAYLQHQMCVFRPHPIHGAYSLQYILQHFIISPLWYYYFTPYVNTYCLDTYSKTLRGLIFINNLSNIDLL